MKFPPDRFSVHANARYVFLLGIVLWSSTALAGWFCGGRLASLVEGFKKKPASIRHLQIGNFQIKGETPVNFTPEIRQAVEALGSDLDRTIILPDENLHQFRDIVSFYLKVGQISARDRSLLEDVSRKLHTNNKRLLELADHRLRPPRSDESLLEGTKIIKGLITMPDTSEEAANILIKRVAPGPHLLVDRYLKDLRDARSTWGDPVAKSQFDAAEQILTEQLWPYMNVSLQAIQGQIKRGQFSTASKTEVQNLTSFLENSLKGQDEGLLSLEQAKQVYSVFTSSIGIDYRGRISQIGNRYSFNTDMRPFIEAINSNDPTIQRKARIYAGILIKTARLIAKEYGSDASIEPPLQNLLSSLP